MTLKSAIRATLFGVSGGAASGLGSLSYDLLKAIHYILTFPNDDMYIEPDFSQPVFDGNRAAWLAVLGVGIGLAAHALTDANKEEPAKRPRV